MMETLPKPYRVSLHKNNKYATTGYSNKDWVVDSTPLADFYDMAAEWV